MKVLVTDACYASSDKLFSVFFIRGRNIYYKQKGIDVTVLDFSATTDSLIDEIQVISLSSFENKYKDEKFDILICHAPNIRNHYIFLKKYQKEFPKIVFFFHGHEVLRVSKVYPKPYSYIKESLWLKRLLRDVYDILKLRMWRGYFKKLSPKSSFVFVSKWMYNEFLKWVKIDEKYINPSMEITYNAVGEEFEKNNYANRPNPKNDFITIRGNIDGSKYCTDIVVELAKNYPQYNFCIVGKGKFFDFNEKPKNVTWVNKHLDHNEVINYLNDSKCALMPTRTDAQGLMACEMATLGIPLITSNIPVCHEIFSEFNNVSYIDNDNFISGFEDIKNDLCEGVPYEKNRKYFLDNTCEKEVQLFKKITK